MGILIGEMYNAGGSGNRINHRANGQVRIAISALEPGLGNIQLAFKNSGGGDTSNLSPGDIPPGIYIECEGTEGDGWGWAVVHPYGGVPIITATDFNENYVPSTLLFTLGLYMHSDNPFAGGGNVRVRVYAGRP